MIIKYLLEFIIKACFWLFGLITSLLPSSELDINTMTRSVLSICSQGGNFMYYLFGDWLYPLTTMILYVIPLKFVIVPIVSTIRGFVRFGSD